MAAHKLNSGRFAIPGVPVFMYHDVCAGAAAGERYRLSLAMFREQLEFLREHGFAVEDLDGLAENSGGGRVVLTFDDGLASHYQRVLPALLERGLTATFFVTTALLGTAGYLGWSQLREMSAAGMTIGSHGHQHIDYSGLEAGAVRRELHRSRASLEDGLGKPAFSFSAPYGFLSRALIESARQAGFRWICSSIPWLAAADATVVSRLAVYHDTDVPRFSALARGCALPVLARRTRDALLYIPKQLLRRGAPQLLGVRVDQEIE